MEKQEQKILEFDRPADFYFQSALKMAERMNYLGALPMIRRALEKDPGNIEYMLKQAEVLTELSKYEESNSILFEVLLKDVYKRQIHTQRHIGREEQRNMPGIFHDHHLIVRGISRSCKDGGNLPALRKLQKPMQCIGA